MAGGSSLARHAANYPARFPPFRIRRKHGHSFRSVALAGKQEGACSATEQFLISLYKKCYIQPQPSFSCCNFKPLKSTPSLKLCQLTNFQLIAFPVHASSIEQQMYKTFLLPSVTGQEQVSSFHSRGENAQRTGLVLRNIQLSCNIAARENAGICPMHFSSFQQHLYTVYLLSCIDGSLHS